MRCSYHINRSVASCEDSPAVRVVNKRINIAGHKADGPCEGCRYIFLPSSRGLPSQATQSILCFARGFPCADAYHAILSFAPFRPKYFRPKYRRTQTYVWYYYCPKDIIQKTHSVTRQLSVLFCIYNILGPSASQIRSYPGEPTGTHQTSVVKLQRAAVVVNWVILREVAVMYLLFFFVARLKIEGWQVDSTHSHKKKNTWGLRESHLRAFRAMILNPRH